MALAPVERIIQLLAIGMEREIRKKSSFRPMTAAKAVILALLQYKVLLAAEKPGKEETAEVRGMIEQWVKGLGAAT